MLPYQAGTAVGEKLYDIKCYGFMVVQQVSVACLYATFVLAYCMLVRSVSSMKLVRVSLDGATEKLP